MEAKPEDRTDSVDDRFEQVAASIDDAIHRLTPTEAVEVLERVGVHAQAMAATIR